MLKISTLSPSDKRKFVFLLLWLAAGIAIIVMGIAAVINGGKALDVISGLLGTAALITGIATVLIRIFQMKSHSKKDFSLDGIIWIILAVLLYKTSILKKLGKLAFIIGGIFMLLEGVRAFFAAFRDKSEKQWYIPRIVFSVIFAVLGIAVILNAEIVFTSMVGGAVGIYLIVHGSNIIYEWIGRAKYFFNNRGLE